MKLGEKYRFSELENPLLSCYHDAIMILVIFERIWPNVIAILEQREENICDQVLRKKQRKIGKFVKIPVHADIL